jgi:hypothetical protein
MEKTMGVLRGRQPNWGAALPPRWGPTIPDPSKAAKLSGTADQVGEIRGQIRK